ncbi:hypothetical protein Psuf_005720 [Phytohabitans suffuscus]|uniref:Uncharacterized protein n=1 Tax=Phytohabitans suffuscus TaxID=624315 RepID=A0A6F8YB51_9ACTN|nr:hypothetical protein Psuf_005720 [Phytohabitans suffuscus]
MFADESVRSVVEGAVGGRRRSMPARTEPRNGTARRGERSRGAADDDRAEAEQFAPAVRAHAGGHDDGLKDHPVVDSGLAWSTIRRNRSSGTATGGFRSVLIGSLRPTITLTRRTNQTNSAPPPPRP